MKTHNIIIIVLLVLVGFLGFWSYNSYLQINAVKTELLATQTQLDQSRSELTNFRQLVESGLTKSKSSTALLNDSLAAFLVAGNLKIASLSDTSAQKISADIQNVPDAQDKVALEQSWNDFLTSRKITDYLAFSRFLIQSVQNSLENIH